MNAVAPPDGYAIAHERDWSSLKPRANFLTRAQILEMCVRASLRVPGNIMEFGVADGSSTRVIRHTLSRYGRKYFAPFSNKKIFALDSFEGLREQFENAPIGMFAGAVPKIKGVQFVKGYFEETCTEALRQQVKSVAFAHLDADLFSSTLCALHWLGPMLSTGSLLLFDEFTGGEFAEFKAFDQWRDANDLEVIRVAEFDREPSGDGHRPDRRLLFQVVKNETLPPRVDKERAAWKLAYYLGRLGLTGLQWRIQNRLI